MGLDGRCQVAKWRRYRQLSHNLLVDNEWILRLTSNLVNQVFDINDYGNNNDEKDDANNCEIICLVFVRLFIVTRIFKDSDYISLCLYVCFFCIMMIL